MPSLKFSFDKDARSAGRYLQGLIEASQDILSASDARETCQKLTIWIKSLLEAGHISIWVTGPKQKHVVLSMEDGSLVYSPDDAESNLRQGKAGQVFTSGQAILVPTGAEFSTSQIIAPLRSKNKVVGLVQVQSGPERGAFTEEDLNLVSALACQAAAALETARTYKAEQDRLQVSAVLVQAGRKLSKGLKPMELPARILEEMALVVPYERGSLLLREGDNLHIAAQRGFPEDERTRRLLIPLREGDVYFQIANSNRPVLIDDVTQADGWSQVAWLPLNLSWLGLPLFSKDSVVGMVSLTRREKEAFSQEDVLMATTFALQASAALDNAALYEEVTRFNQQLEQMVQQRTEELKKAMSTLERLDKNRADFINVAAHELRTPLTVMMGYLGMLGADQTVRGSAYLGEAVDGVLKGSERLHEIINSMLDVARIDNQVLELMPELVSVSSILKRVQADCQTYILQRKQTLNMVELERLPLIKGDSTLLLKVFQHLALNAIKYTPDGGTITIRGMHVQDAALGECVEVTVQDTGIGIDPDQHELIFEKLYSTGKVALHSSGKATFKGGGPGLSLAIARGIILAHKGRIWVESERHDEEKFPGSCFHVLLPVSQG